MVRKTQINHNGIDYKHIESKEISSGAIHLLDKKILIKGKPEITITSGSYKHGDEVQFRIWDYKENGFVETNRNPSRYNSIEIYVKKDKAIKLLKEALKELEK